MKPHARKVAHTCILAIILTANSVSTHGQSLDRSWTVTVKGQSIQANDDGSFHLPNVSAPDNFGPGGPGTAPDLASDDFVRAIGVSRAGGQTRYAFSDPFQFRQGQTFIIGDMTITDTPPPFPTSISIAAASTLLPVSETAQLTVTGTLLDGSTTDVTPRTSWTTYRTSNPAVATVGQDGLVTAMAPGIVFMTAINEGATAVKRLNVTAAVQMTIVEGFVVLADGTSVAGATVTTPFGDSTTTSSDGSFSFEIEIPSEGKLRLTASATVSAELLGGSSGNLEVIANGFTDAGVIVISPSTLWGSVPQSRQIVSVDPATGATQLVATITEATDNITEIEWSPDGSTLFATTGGGSSTIYTVDPKTGAILTSVSHPFGALNGLAFDAEDNLFGTQVGGPEESSELVRVNTATGALTTIGSTGFFIIGGLAFDDSGRLFGITSSNQSTPPNLLTINTDTGQVSVIAATDIPSEASSLEFDATGRLLTGASDGNLYEIDPETGVSTLIGPMGIDKLSGLSLGPSIE